MILRTAMLFAAVVCYGALGDDEKNGGVEPLEDAPPLVKESKDILKGAPAPMEETNLLEMFIFLDTSFSIGRSVYQGFEVSAARFGARGDIAPFADYRFMAGQTKEFSSAQLTQLTVVDAWIRAHNGKRIGTPPTMTWRVGMFTPSVNPWWSPDLVDLPALPDYALNHEGILPNRDLGTEFLYRPFEGVEVVAGIFNGSGITNLNTNNSRGFNGLLRGRLNLGGAYLEAGVGGYLQQQADSTSVNYINNAAGSFFLSLGDRQGAWWLAADITSGRIEDSIASNAALGAGLAALFDLGAPLHLFVRGEVLRYTPDSAGNLERVQAGPMLVANEWLRAFLLYEYRRNASGAESAADLQFRVSL